MRHNKAYKLAAIALIILVLSVSVVSAAPAEGRGSPDYCEKVVFANVFIKNQPSCFLSYCVFTQTIRWHGMDFLATVRGLGLRQGQRVSVEATVCTNGTGRGFRLVK